MSERRIGVGQIPRLGVALEVKSDPERRLGSREYGVLTDIMDMHKVLRQSRGQSELDAKTPVGGSQRPWWRLYCNLRFCLSGASTWPKGALPYYVTETGVLIPITDCRYSRGLVEFVVTLGEEPFLASGSTEVFVTDQPDVGWLSINDILEKGSDNATAR